MATISKFYLLDAVTLNKGTMPTNSPAVIDGGVLGTGSEAAGASTARDATDTPGTANPDTKSVITAQASVAAQRLGHRRFVSRPLAATTLSGTWTWNFAALDSNTNHTTTGTDGPTLTIYAWRPSTGTQVGTATNKIIKTLTLTASEANYNPTSSWSASQAILDGDILVFDIYSNFTQGMATAYTDTFCYNGTTENSITTSASFVQPNTALTLFFEKAIPVPTHLPFMN